MKKTNLLVTTLMLLMCLGLTAQSLKVQKSTISYVDLPNEPMAPEMQTYSVTVKGSKSDWTKMNVMPSKFLKANFNFTGKKRVEKGGHFNIEIVVGASEILGDANESRDIKKGTGSKAVTVKEHYKVISAMLPITYTIKDASGKVMEEDITSNDVTFTYGYGKGYKTRVIMSKAYESSKASIYMDGLNRVFTSEMEKLETTIRDKYDYAKKEQKIEFFLLKGSDEDANMSKHIANVEKAFASYKEDGASDGAKSEIEAAIEYWASLTKKYDASNKKEKKVHFAGAFNAAVASLWMGWLDAGKYHAKAKNVGVKKFRTAELGKEMVILEKDLEVNEGMDRQYLPDLSSAEAPDSGFEGGFFDEVPASTSGTSMGGVISEGYMVDLAGTKYEGTFVFPSGSPSSPKFGSKSKSGVEFHYEKDGQKVVSDLNPKNISGFHFNGQTYAAADAVGLGSALMTKGKRIIYQMLYHSDKIAVMAHRQYFYPTTKEGHDEFVVVKKANEDKLHNTGDLSFVMKFKKKMAALYEDCSKLSQMYLDGKLRNEEADHVRAAKIYTDECK